MRPCDEEPTDFQFVVEHRAVIGSMGLRRPFVRKRLRKSCRRGQAATTSTKIGDKGQLTVPRQFREDLGVWERAPGESPEQCMPISRTGSCGSELVLPPRVNSRRC
jgi:hypothetical protein